jgi:coproporphyrinogen III oxidase-like Fe-S oxidoreductase
MLAERFLTNLLKPMIKRSLKLDPCEQPFMPGPKPGEKYMLYLHVPFCERLCPYCSFNRYPFKEEIAKPYYESMRKEMLMLKNLGYDFESMYFGGGTPTVMLDELCETIDLARSEFSVTEVGVETNPNHLVQPWLDKLSGRVNRLSVGVQSFDDGLLRQMDRYEKYGSGELIMDRIKGALPYFDSLNVDMIFNFPTQTEEILFSDLEHIVECGARQTTFSPLYRSNATMKKMQNTLGEMNWEREFRFYKILDGLLTGGDKPFFERETVWTFNRLDTQGHHDNSVTIDEYQTSYNEYPAIGSGSITHLDGCLFVNHFSLNDYNSAIDAGHMSIMGKSVMSKRDLMRYYFLLHLYRLRLDKLEFKREFGCSIEAGLPVEMSFMAANGAFATNTKQELTLTERGRYLILVMYREFLAGMNNLREQARARLTGPESHLLFGDGTEM